MIPMREIQRYCDGIAAAFKPQRIILFGSYAYGKPTEDLDVDVMVELDDKLARRIADRESFIFDLTQKGKAMYDAKAIWQEARLALGL